MTPQEKRLVEALSVLEALRPFQNTGWNSDKLSHAWDKAKATADACLDKYLAEVE